MKKQYQGVLIYLAVLIGMMWIFGQFAEKQKADSAYSYTQFVEAVEAGEVRSAQISQNKEVPTGNVVFTLVNGEQKNTNLPDVTKAEAQLIAGGVDVTFGDVKRSRVGGKGLDGVVEKGANYMNPFINLMKGRK